MEAMNKWLAFSLSGGGHHHTEQQSSAAMHPGISDWSADGAGGDPNCRRTQYSSASSSSGDQLSMLMGAPAAAGSSSCSNNRNSNMISELYEQPEAPKLENFLGLHPFVAQCNPYADCPDSMSRPNILASYNLASGNSNNHCSEDATGETNSCNNLVRNQPNNGSSSIGLSMIKSWLRNQPQAPPAGPPLHGDNQQQLIIEHSNGTASSAQNNNLSLSMSAEGELQSLSSSSAPLSLLAPTMPHGAGTSLLSDLDRENSSSNNDNDNKLQQQDSFAGMDSQNSSSSCAIEAVPRRSLDTFGQRTSIYRGVTRHRWTGRYEAHLWDNSCRREGQTRKGRQVYLGGYDKEEKAARAYDLAALKYWGPTTTTNFPISNYEKELEEMKHMTRQEFIASLRRKSSGFSRGASIYRGVTRHHQHGRWQARIGRVAGNKDLYLGTFSTQEEAAEAYDIAAIKFRGLNAVTNFDMSRYDVKSILESTTLPVGTVRRLKDVAYQHHHQGQGQSQGHHRATPTDIFQGADFLRNGSLMNPYENHAGGGAMATVLGGIHSYSDTAGWPSVPGTALSLPQAAPGGPFPLYGYGQSVQRTWGCKQEQQDQDADDNSAFNHRRHHFSSSGVSNTTHNFFQPVDSAGSSMMMLPPNYLMNSAAVVSNPDFQVLSTAYASNAAEYGSVNDHHNHDNGNDHRSVMYGSSADNAGAYGNYQAAAAARILYQSNHSTDGSNGDRYVSWVPTGIPMAGSSSSNTSSRSSPVGNTNMSMNRHEAPTFTVWPE